MENDNGLVARLAMAVGGGALVVSAFLVWYSLSLADVLRSVASQLPGSLTGSLSGAIDAGAPTLTWSGWHAVHLVRFVVLVVGLAALAAAAAPPRTAGDRGGLLVPAAGLLAIVLVGYRIESPPSTLDFYIGPLAIHSPAGAWGPLSSLLTVDAGAWVALGGGVAVVVGGLLAYANARAAAAAPSPAPPVGPASGTAPHSWSW